VDEILHGCVSRKLATGGEEMSINGVNQWTQGIQCNRSTERS